MRRLLDPRRATPVVVAFILVVASAAGAGAQTVGAGQATHTPRTATMAPSSGRVGGQANRPTTDLFIEVPLAAPSPGVVFPFGGSHHQVPGVVAVDRAPYYCTPHQRAFRERADFVAHLRTRHHLSDADIPAAVLVEGGQVRYVGD